MKLKWHDFALAVYVIILEPIINSVTQQIQSASHCKNSQWTSKIFFKKIMLYAVKDEKKLGILVQF